MIPLRLTFDPADISASRDLPPTDVDAATAQEIATVRIEPSPLLQAIVDQARQQSETLVPLIGGGNGRMDSDAAAHRTGGHGKHVMAAGVQRGAQMMAERRGKRRPKERKPNATSPKPTPEFGPDSFPWRAGELIIGIPRRHAAGRAEADK